MNALSARGLRLVGASALVMGCASQAPSSAVLIPRSPPVPSEPAPLPKPPVAEASPREPADDMGDAKGEVGARARLFGTDLKSAKGNVIVVHVWASWCMPCHKAMPKLEAIYRKYKASGLSVVAISVDDEEPDATDFVKSLGVTYQTPWDDGRKLVEAWKPRTMPTTYVVDREGVVRFLHAGYTDGEEVAIEREVKGLL